MTKTIPHCRKTPATRSNDAVAKAENLISLARTTGKPMSWESVETKLMTAEKNTMRLRRATRLIKFALDLRAALVNNLRFM